MAVPTVDGTREERWEIDIRWLRVSDAPVKISARRPCWHTLIYFGGLAGVCRATLSLVGSPNLTVLFLVYGACMMLAPVLGKLLPSRGERIARICSGNLSLAGLVLSNVAPALGRPAQHAVSSSVSLLVPLAAGGLVLMITCVGAVMFRYFPSRTPEHPTWPSRPSQRAGAPAGSAKADQRRGRHDDLPSEGS